MTVTDIVSPALMPHILVVDDDDRLRDLLRRFLVTQGFIVATAKDASAARDALAVMSFDLMVLDVMMPGETGLELTKSLRAKPLPSNPQLPILLLTAKGEADDRIAGLETGADDYLSKPFEPRELALRIHSILRRAPAPMVVLPTLKLGKWTYDAQRDELSSSTEKIRLTDMEASLMRILARDPGGVMTREALGGQGAVNMRTVDVQVTRLRRRFEDDPKNPRYLVTVRGEGYRLLPDIK